MNNWLNAFNRLPATARYLTIAALASVLFFPLLGGVHLFDWDEINFAECAREMIVTKDYIRCQIDFMPFWEKPPVFIWMQAAAMQVFGVGEYAARFPNACIGLVAMLTLYYTGSKLRSREFGLWWVAAYMCSWLPQFYFKTGIIDPTFNFLIFLAIYQLYLLKWGQQKLLHSILAGLFLGLAVLTKGPVAILVVLL
ncbi:MAG: phospholipid carrier-dependent glycosyltransferase, partial [Chitinophagia bacterium]|nr:phospholipid carrier-dependent glycosyltransferase [Chitinophagia bacterium]